MKLQITPIKENMIINSKSELYQDIKHDMFNIHFYEALAKYENSKKRKIDLKKFLWYSKHILLHAINHAIQDNNSIQLDDALRRIKFHNPKTIYNCLISSYMLTELEYLDYFDGDYYELPTISHIEFLKVVKFLSESISSNKYISLFDIIEVGNVNI